MSCTLAIVSLFLLSFTSVVSATSSCVAFDTNWNLLAFNFSGKDFNVGTQGSWTQVTPTDITAQGRPPFTGSNISCYLSQFTNAIYVLGADSVNPAAIYIYDATAKSWSTQSVNPGDKFDPTDFDAILDHDTNVFYAYSKGELFSLDMQLLKAANATTKQWNDVQNVPWDTTSYQPTMALAQNHVHFLGVPGVPGGSAMIFVIHFSFMQPLPQTYGNFPNTHGQATSFFKDSGVQTKFAFIPDDCSATYVIDVTSNSTQTLKAPANRDPRATYFASTSALVQLSSSGSVSFLAFNQDGVDTNADSEWTAITNLPIATPTSNAVIGPGSSAGPSATSGSPGGNSGSGTPNDNHNNSAISLSFAAYWMWSMIGLLLGIAFL